MIASAKPERRHHTRHTLRGYARLVTPHQKWPVHLLDLSMNGALVALLEYHQLDPHEEAILTLEFDDQEPIKLQGHIAHHKEHYIGLECAAVSLNHQARLRELLTSSEHGFHHDPDRDLQQILSDQSE